MPLYYLQKKNNHLSLFVVKVLLDYRQPGDAKAAGASAPKSVFPKKRSLRMATNENEGNGLFAPG